MNLEELQTMSDAELNKLSATKVMAYGYRGYCEDPPVYPYVSLAPNGNLVLYTSDDCKRWNPVIDMNDAMELVNKVCAHYTFYIFIKGGMTLAEIGMNKVHDQSPSRAITIASILAKEGHND